MKRERDELDAPPPMIFISYAEEDAKAADEICGLLEERGIQCWIAPRDVPPGAAYYEAIMNGINRVKGLVLVLSESANESRHVRSEVERAFSLGKSVFPIRIKEIEPTHGLEFFIYNTQWIDAWQPPMATQIDRLSAAVKCLAGVAPEVAIRPAAPEPSGPLALFEQFVDGAWSDGRLDDQEKVFLLERAARLGIAESTALELMLRRGTSPGDSSRYEHERSTEKDTCLSAFEGEPLATKQIGRGASVAIHVSAPAPAAEVQHAPLEQAYQLGPELGGHWHHAIRRSDGQPVLIDRLACIASEDTIARCVSAIPPTIRPEIVRAADVVSDGPGIAIVYPWKLGIPMRGLFVSVPVTKPRELLNVYQLAGRVCECMASGHAIGLTHGTLAPPLIQSDSADNVSLYGYAFRPLLPWRAKETMTPDQFIESFGDSLSFLSPQVLSGEREPLPIDDIFSIGAILYYLLTGKSYADFAALQSMVHNRAVYLSPPLPIRTANPRVLPSVVTLVETAISLDPARRTVTIPDFIRVLQAPNLLDQMIESIGAHALEEYDAGRLLEAYQLIEEGLDLDPGNAALHLARGKIYFSEGEFKWAVKEWESASAILSNPQTLGLLGKAYLAVEGRTADAVRVLQRAIAYGHNDEIAALLERARKNLETI